MRVATIPKTARYGLFVGLLLAQVLHVFPDSPRVCQDTLTSTGAVDRLCRDQGPMDPQLVAFYLVLLILLWPDITQIGVAGISIQKRIEQTRAEIATVSDRVTLSEQRFQFLSSQFAQSKSQSDAAAVSSSQATNNVFVGNDFGTDSFLKTVLVERLGPAPPPPLPSPVPQPPDSDEPSQFAFKRSLTLIKLLHLWEDITDGYSEARGELPGWIRAADDEALVDDYRAVLQTRNRVAHAKPIPNDILAGAIAAAEGLAAVKQDLDDRPPSTDELILREVASSVLDDYLRQPNHGIGDLQATYPWLDPTLDRTLIRAAAARLRDPSLGDRRRTLVRRALWREVRSREPVTR